MLLRFLMLLLKPSTVKLIERKPNTFLRFHIWLYQSILKILLKTYSHYAIDDTVCIKIKGVKIVHQYRDLEFERELARNKIDVAPHLFATNYPMTVAQSKRTWGLKFFKFTDLVSVYVDGKELFVKHDGVHSVDGTLNANIKCSSPKDIINRSEIVYTHKEERVKNERRQTVTVQNRPFMKETPSLKHAAPFGAETTQTKVTKANIAPVPTIVEKQGFDIDTTF